MPARTTVISSLSKRTDRGHRLLNASEFLQMAGRAGRRGMDKLGYVVTVQTPFEGAQEAAYLSTSGSDPLVSQFTPSYGMVLNLLQTHTLEEAHDLIERSFGHYLSTLYLKPQQQAIDDLSIELERQQAQLAEIESDLLAGYEKLHERLKEERRLLKTLQLQAQEIEAETLATAVSFAVSGTVLTLKGKHVPVPTPLPAVLVMKTQGAGQFPYLVCLGQNNRWYVITVSDVVGLHPEFPRLSQVDALVPPAELAPKAGSVRKGDEESRAIAQQIPVVPPDLDVPPEVQDQLGRVKAVEAQLQSHALHQFGDPANLLKRHNRIAKLREDIESRRSKLNRYTQRYWQEFLNLMEILEYFGCLERVETAIEPEATESEATETLSSPKEQWQATPIGQIAAAIRGDNELWLGLALASGELDGLDPHHLAAACSALVTEVSRPDNWTHYDMSSEVLDALSGLRRIRRELFKLQRRYQVALPVWLETEWIGLVEQWALGIEWTDLVSHTSLDEGDVVRILRRTVDFLSQVPHVPHLSPDLQKNAKRAIQLIDRFPVNEGGD